VCRHPSSVITAAMRAAHEPMLRGGSSGSCNAGGRDKASILRRAPIDQ
jgi:hypothetical protein